MTTYLVRIVSGPAKGWEYTTTVIPYDTIAVAPNPGGQTDVGGKNVHGDWMRVPLDGPPWPGERRYRRGPLPAFGRPLGDDQVTTDGDVIVNYEAA